MSGMEKRHFSPLDRLLIVENVDSSAVRQPEYLFGMLGFGADPATIDPDFERNPRIHRAWVLYRGRPRDRAGQA